MAPTRGQEAMEFSISQTSRIGGRETNEDRSAYTRTPEALLLVVADGMGGHLHGEVAAETAIRTLAQAFGREAMPKLDDVAGFLSASLRAAHGAIVHHALAEQLDDVPGTTCVACVIQDGMAFWAHVGDSRLYVVRGGAVIARTRDHSLARQLADLGDMDDAEAEMLPGRNVLYNSLGGYKGPQIELSEPIALQPGDSLLLCSDGLWGSVADREIAAGMSRGSLSVALARLVLEAEVRAGYDSDNVTGLAVRWGVTEKDASPAPEGAVVTAA